jgi:formate/nitrite transporter FocA (FNT family)
VSPWLRALIATCLIEVPIVVAVFPKQRLAMALAALVANIATNLALNLVLLPRGQLWLGEAIALAFEASVYYWLGRPRDLARSLVASAAGNLLSFGFGGVLARILF